MQLKKPIVASKMLRMGQNLFKTPTQLFATGRTIDLLRKIVFSATLLATSGVEQSKGHTGQGSLGESMLETVTLMPTDAQQQQ